MENPSHILKLAPTDKKGGSNKYQKDITFININ